MCEVEEVEEEEVRQTDGVPTGVTKRTTYPADSEAIQGTRNKEQGTRSKDKRTVGNPNNKKDTNKTIVNYHRVSR